MYAMPGQHRYRGNSRKRVTTLSLSLGGVLTLGAGVLGVSFAATTDAPAQPNMNCTLTVPADPLSAQGLATPYTLTATDPAQGPCHESNANQAAFVQATVVDPATGTVSVYDPLVTDAGTAPAAPPVVPTLPAGAVVGIWFGFNGSTLTMAGNTAAGKCVGGTAGQPFGQFAYCNAPAFFAAANKAEQAGLLTVPPIGTARNGMPCLTTRDFGLVDQDQSDNVTSEYLVTAAGATAQNNAANSAALPGGTAIVNGSDNLLLTQFEDPALGCTPWSAPDLANPGSTATSLALNELQAAKYQAAPIALVPTNDPMVLDNNKQSATRTNLYRAGVNQPPLGGTDNGDPVAYCADLANRGANRIKLDQPLTSKAKSPDDAMNLFDFLTQRLAASLTNLGCQNASTSPKASPTTGASATASAMPTASATMSTAPTGTVGPSTTPTMSTAPTRTAGPSSTPTMTTAPTRTASPSTTPTTSTAPTMSTTPSGAPTMTRPTMTPTAPTTASTAPTQSTTSTPHPPLPTMASVAPAPTAVPSMSVVPRPATNPTTNPTTGIVTPAPTQSTSTTPSAPGTTAGTPTTRPTVMSVAFMKPGTAPAKQLASTGGGSSSNVLFTVGGTCIAIGLVALLLAARNRPRTQPYSRRRR